MAFCTNCGSQLADNAKFCVNCGNPTAAGAAAGGATYYPPAPPVPPLSYEIEGHNLQIARVHLQPGQEIYAEAGKMIYKSANIDWQTRMTGQSIGDKIIGVFQRGLRHITVLSQTGRAGKGFLRYLPRFRPPVPVPVRRFQGPDAQRGGKFSPLACGLCA